MKKGFLVFGFAVAMASITSCGNKNAEQSDEMTQEQLDSLLQWQADSAEAARQHIEDSILLEEARAAEEAALNDAKPVPTPAPKANSGSGSTSGAAGHQHDEVPATPAKKSDMRSQSDQAKEANKTESSMRSQSDQAKEADKTRSSMRNQSDQAKQNN